MIPAPIPSASAKALTLLALPAVLTRTPLPGTTIIGPLANFQSWAGGAGGSLFGRFVARPWDSPAMDDPVASGADARDHLSESLPGRIRSSDLPAVAAVFALVITFTYSEDVVLLACQVFGLPDSTPRPWLVFALDCVVVAGTALLKWRISPVNSVKVFLRRLVTGWWGLGAALGVGAHLVLIATENNRSGLGNTASIWINLLVSLVFVASITLLLLSALSEGTTSRGWVVPLVIGTFAVMVASALWYPAIDFDIACGNDVSSTYFSEVTNIMVVLLLTLGVEMNFVRRNAGARDPGERVAPVFIVMLLCVALALAITMLAKADLGPFCNLGAVWHEYISFMITIQAMATALATLVWLMLTDAVDGD